MTAEEEMEHRQTEAQAEERMAQITNEYFSQKDGEVEGVTEEPEEAATIAKDEPKQEDATTTPEADKDASTAILDATQATPEALSKEGEESPEAAAPPTPEQPPTKDELDAELEAFDAELEKGPKAKKGANPNIEKAITHYKKRARAAKEAEIAAKRQAKELEKKQAEAKVLDPDTEKELSELRTFKRNIDIEHDPEFAEKYTKGAEDLRTQAMGVIKASGILPANTEKFIEDNGGLLRFRSSSATMPRGLKDENGNAVAQHADGTPFSHAEFYREYIEKNLLPEQREEITAIGLEARNLQRQREQELNAAKAKGEAGFKEKAETAQKQREEWQSAIKEAALAEVAKLGAVAKKQEVPSNATAVEKALIDARNARIDRAAGITQRLLSEASPQNLASMAVTKAYHETVFPDLLKGKDEEIDDWKKRAEAAEKRLDDIKRAGKTSNKDNAPPPETNKTKESSKIDDPEERMMAYMGGK